MFNQCDQKKNNVVFRRSFLFAIGILIFFSFAAMASDKSSLLHSKGKKYVRERKWDNVIQIYNQLLMNHSGSVYDDDAKFWIAFSQEQMAGMEKDAFESYEEIIEEHPNSPWRDDAVVHQIYIAQKLSKSENGLYTAFLHQMIYHEDLQVRFLAALALGELKDPIALPLLEEIARGEDEDLAMQAIEALKGYSDIIEKDVPEEEFDASDVESLRESDEKIIYRNLAKQGKTWTDERLFQNGIFHIVSKKDLIFYLSLENNWDQKEWWRKFGESRDPTPTTVGNEA